MATFKAVVLRHQKRRDEKYSVSIRVTQNRQSSYISTGLYCHKNQINKKTFEIKDQFILERTNKTIRDFEEKLLNLDTLKLKSMSADELKKYLLNTCSELDYIQFCHKLVDDNPKLWAHLHKALNIIEGEMGYQEMPVTEFTASFIREFKKVMDTRNVKHVQKDGVITYKGKMAIKTKSGYLVAICAAFRRMKEAYNTEFNQVIKHDPFVGLEPYKQEMTKRRAMPVETLRAFFDITPKTPTQKLAQDMMRLSFCLCGINVIDLFEMKQENYERKEGRLNYQRQKTKGRRYDKAFSSIRIEPEIYDTIKKYETHKGEKLFYFGKYTRSDSLDRTLCNACWEISEQLELDYHISPYWFRHTWATIARNDCDISKDDIDLCLNHVGNNPMADVYIKPDWSRIDNANRKVLDYVFGKQRER